MKILRSNDAGFRKQWKRFNRTFQSDPKVEKTVAEVLREVRNRGDAAVCEFTEQFGGPRLQSKQLPVSPAEIAAAQSQLPKDLKKAILASKKNVEKFARRGLRKTWFTTNAQGARTGERFDPLQRVGIYIPGGSAPLISSAIMTVTLAKTAAVPEIVATTPPGPDGTVHPALLSALFLCGATEIYKVGGAQAIAAMAFGTKTILPVLKVFGPGSAWVVEAKRQLFGTVGVDLLPGPSEVLVIADESANPAWAAADLLAQAEHGHGSITILLADSESLVRKVEKEIHSQLQTLHRAEALRESLKNCCLVVVKSLGEAVQLANEFAPEHTVVMTQEPGNVAAGLRSSGAIFLGGLSPVAAGDFLAGPSHELPTGGAGKAFAGLTVDQFQRRTSIVRYDREALARSVDLITTISNAEGLDAHARSASIRLE